MRSFRAFLSELAELPPVARFTVTGALAGAVIGGAVGLVVGLIAYPPTAWFAILEAGAPGAIAGGMVGFLCWFVSRAFRLLARR